MWTLHNGFWDFAVMFAFWALIFGLIYLAIRALVDRPGGDSEPRARAEEILGERFARGEISAEEYRERRETLAGERPAARAEAGTGAPA